MNGRKLSGLFWCNMSMARYLGIIYLGKCWSWEGLRDKNKLVGGVGAVGNVLLGILGPFIHVHHTLTSANDVHIIADKIHSFMATIFSHGSAIFQQDNASSTHCTDCFRTVCPKQGRVPGIVLASKWDTTEHLHTFRCPVAFMVCQVKVVSVRHGGVTLC